MGENETNKLINGALLLTFAGLVSKVLSAGYRIPLQNFIGDIGFYTYQQIYPLLGIATALALYGFPSAISKLTAEMRRKGYQISFHNFYSPILLLLFVVCSLIFLIIYMNAPVISTWVGDNHLVSAYRMAAFVFLLIPLTSLMRGIFQGYEFMQPTAYSQIGEQVLRVVIIICAAYLISKYQLSVHHIGQAASLASFMGSLVAILILGLFFRRVKPFQQGVRVTPWRHFCKTILLFGLVASLNHLILIIIQFADTLTLVPNLMDYGLTQWEAKTMKGIFDRGQPLIQIGAVVGSSFALALIPNLTKKDESIYSSIQSALKFSFYLAFAAMIGLILILPETNTLLFKNGDETDSIQILAISILLSSVAMTGTTVLQGLGFLKRTALFILLAFVVKWIGNQFIVPYFGIMGGALATVLSLFVLCSLVLSELKRKLPALSIMQTIKWRPFLIGVSGLVIYISSLQYFLPNFGQLSRLSLLGRVVFLAGTGAAIYLFLMIRFGAFSKQELSRMPYAGFLTQLLKEESYERKN